MNANKKRLKQMRKNARRKQHKADLRSGKVSLYVKVESAKEQRDMLCEALSEHFKNLDNQKGEDNA